MTVPRPKFGPRREGRNFVDDLLIGLATACAVYSGGQAVGSEMVSYAALGAVLVGTVASSLLARALRNTWVVRADGVLYLLLGLGAFLGARTLNTVFPPDTFPRELQPSSWLIWMLMFGSFVTWRDATLLFQAIPSLALFGFVGCYDTFRPVVFFFFVYLICVATLFARTHARDMAHRAELSGYFGADLPNLRASDTVTAELKRGPWRWVAGPEWALGSAFAIVVLSLVGAPAVRQGVKPISGVARVSVPNAARRQNQGAVSGAPTTPQSSARIAQGPVRLRNTPAFDVTAQGEAYFRTNGFDAYVNGVWSKDWSWTDRNGNRETPSPRRRSSRFRVGDERRDRVYPQREPGRAPNFRDADLSARPTEPYAPVSGPPVPGPPAPARPSREARRMLATARDATSAVPVPGEYLEIEQALQNRRDPGGGVALATPLAYERLPIVYAPTPAPDPGAVSGALPAEETGGLADPALSLGGVSPAVLDFARRAAGEGPDGTRAERLRRAIAGRIAYNINAEAPPPGVDPIENALFTTKQGYCDVFASAMVLGARGLGIPARYATGYVGDEKNRAADGTLVLLDSDSHAWAELYFAGRGWVPYDATAGARVVPGGGRRQGDPTSGGWAGISAANLVNGAIALLAVAGAALLLWPRRKAKGADLRARDALVARFVGSIERATGRVRRRDETLGEFVGAAELGSETAPARDLARAFERLLYAPATADEGALAPLAERVNSLRTALKRLPKPAR